MTTPTQTSHQKTVLNARFCLLILVISAVCFSLGLWAQAQTAHVISQKDRTYAPGEITISAGESIKVINDDMFLHHTYIDEPNMQFDSGSFDEGESRVITFDTPGKYDVKCDIHPKMLLEVTVE